MKNKKGSHVGVVLSFLIFILFLSFLYPTLIKPAIGLDENKGYILDDVKISFMKNVSSDLTTATIVVNSLESCIELSNLLTDLKITSKIIVKNELGENQNTHVTLALPNNLQIEKNEVNNNFFKIYSSEEFDQTDSSSVSCTSAPYTKGLVKLDNYVFEKKIIDLIEEYEDDYELLKNKLKISKNDEFDFSFIYNNKTEIGIKKEVSTNIYVEEVQTQYVSKEGDILLGSIIIRVW